MKIGRNEPCPCGSGQKYKKCCLEKDRQSQAAQETQVTREQVAADPGGGNPSKPRSPKRGASVVQRTGPAPPRPTAIRRRSV